MTSAARWALVHELRGDAELTLGDALMRLSPCDLVLVEGWKREAMPKLEVWREDVGKPRLHRGDPHVLAVATDAPARAGEDLPAFDLRDVDAIATFILANAAAWPVAD